MEVKDTSFKDLEGSVLNINHLSEIKEVVVSLIYHGRHFNPQRDDIVIRKSILRINDIFQKGALKGRGND